MDYYFNDGARSAAHLDELVAEFHSDHTKRPLCLLEFASGYGMVSRHLGRMKERYAFTACDIHEQAIEFLRTEIGVEAVISRTDPDDLALSGDFDVIFSLSFFSHVPHRTWGRWLQKLYSALANDGLLIFTTHGRGAMTGQAGHSSCRGDTGSLPPASKRTSGRKITERFW
jgi:SAM-dependent methyltransferase